MAKQGLIRIPFYPQLGCLARVHQHAPLVMSALLFWMSRNQTAATFCEQRHNYQLALHLGLSYEDFTACMAALHEQQLFIKHEITIKPKEYTPEAKDKLEIRLSLDFAALHSLLQRLGYPLDLKLLLHAADDSFDCYDVIDLKQLPIVQSLHGQLSNEAYLQACVEACRFMIHVNEHCENIAAAAIAPGWKLLLTVPLDMSEEDYAQSLAVRFIRPNERAIDFNFTDGNFFLPCFDEIQTKVHSVKHYRKHSASMTLAAALMLHLQEHFGEHVYFTSELSVEKLASAMMLCYEVNNVVPVLRNEYYVVRHLSAAEVSAEKERYNQIAERIRQDGLQLSRQKSGSPDSI